MKYQDELDYELSKAVDHINNALDKYVTDNLDKTLLRSAITNIMKVNNDNLITDLVISKLKFL